MFEKFKDRGKLIKAQSEIKKQLENIFVVLEKADIRIVVRGDKKIEKLEIDGADNKPLRELINDSFKEVDKKVEKQTRGQWEKLVQ